MVVVRGVLEALIVHPRAVIATMQKTRIITRLARKGMNFQNLVLQRMAVVRGVLEALIVHPRAVIATMQKTRIIMCLAATMRHRARATRAKHDGSVMAVCNNGRERLTMRRASL